MDEKKEIELKEKKMRFEALIQSWNNTEMWLQESWLQIPGNVTIVTDDWGVVIKIDSEHYPREISLSGRWDILSIWETGMSAMYCGWTIDKQIIWPELGFNPKMSPPILPIIE